MITDFLLKIADIIYPRICPVCGHIVSKRGRDICPQCEDKLSFVGNDHCMKCGKPVDEDVEYCSDCSGLSHIYDEGRAALLYDTYMSKSIYRFKYAGKQEFAEFYGRVICEQLGDKIKSWNVDAIIPVPVHRDRLKKRGYNQAELIAGQMSKRLKIPVRSDLVTRQKGTLAQKNLSARDRQNNLKKAFKVTGNVVKLDSVLVVDDIYTTGATVDAMAGCLKGAGIRRVYFTSLCIGRGN
ncbi:MAG: ComF family protein [Lachnospiraceae bacterium]|nr:ComF family protein [Lachnospiraceae bacterium]